MTFIKEYRCMPVTLMIALGIGSMLVLASPALGSESSSATESSAIPEDETQLKCDACTLISQKVCFQLLS